MERKTNTGLPKATMGGKGRKGRKGGGSGSGSGGGSGSAGGRGRGGGSGGGSGGAVGGSDRNRNAKGKVLSGRFSQQLENRAPAAGPKRKKPYVCFPGNAETTAYYKTMYIEISDGKVGHFKSKSSFTM